MLVGFGSVPRVLPPKPSPMLVAPPMGPARVESAVIAQAHVTQTQRPAMAVDAESANDPLRTTANGGGPPPRRTTPPVAAVATPTFRAVRIQPRPGSVLYSINGETPRPWNSSDERVLPVGQPSTISFFGAGFQPFIWRSDGNVAAGDEPIRVVARMIRVSSPAPGTPDAHGEAQP